jgi:DNA-binding HxlR family transcriptional regulator
MPPLRERVMPKPIFSRIVTALLLAPMDSRQLTDALSIKQSDICHRLLQLHEANIVRRVGIRRHNRYPAICHALTSKGRRWAEELIV